LAAAIESSQSEAFTTFSNFRDNAILIGILSVNKNATNLSDITQARFLLMSKFGETVGAAGGISTTNLQQAYNNSATPEIVTNSAEGALTIQNGEGTADNVTNLFEGKGSSAGPLSGTTSFIRADGLISGSSISTPGFTANTGGLTALTISATTYLNLPSATFTGGTVSGPTNFTSGLTANTISATTISGDTLYGDGSNLTNVPNIYNVDGSLTGARELSLGGNDLSIFDDTFMYRYVFENKNGFKAIDENTITTVFSINVGIATIDVNGIFQTQSSVYLNNLPPDNTTPYLLGLDGTNQVTAFDANYVYNSITGGTYSSGTLSLINNSGGTVSISGFSTGGSFTGGTVTGPTNFTSGLTANTISATTYLNLPSSTFTGGTVSGPTNFTSGLTANTISATTYLNLPTDIRVTGATYSYNNSFTFTNNTGGTFSVSFDFFTGYTAFSESITISPTKATSPIGTLSMSEPTSMDIQGNYLYIQSKGILRIVDVSRHSAPQLISTLSLGADQTQKLTVSGRYLYVVGDTPGILRIINISNPSSPVLVSTASTISADSNSIYAQGSYLYLTNETSQSLQIFDVSNPTSAISVSNTLIMSNPKSVFVQGNYAYVVGNTSGIIQVIDVSTPSSPTIVGSGSTSGTTPTSVYVVGRFAYVANSGSNNFRVIDVSTPSAPVSVGSSTITSATTVYVQGNYAYIAGASGSFGSGSFWVVDISNPASPQSLFGRSTSEFPTDIIVQGRYLYIISTGLGVLEVFDLGSSYIQQLEAGGIETTTLTTLSNATVGNDLTVVGGMNVNQSLNVQGDISARSVRVLPVALTVISNTATTDASLSSLFTLTLTGNTTLATPINGFSGQRILYQLKQDGTGSKLLTLSSGFRSGPITVTLSTAANTTDYLGVIYNAIDNKWDVLALNKGYS
jgi:hypothetical protein